MTPDYVAVRPEWKLEEALSQVRERGHDSETIDVIYVTDADWKLLDALSLRCFILADPQVSVAEIMDYTFESLSAFADRKQAVRAMQRYDLAVLPVVNSTGVLVGIVTFDDVLDVAQEELSEHGRLRALPQAHRVARRACLCELVLRRCHRPLSGCDCGCRDARLLPAALDRQRRERRPQASTLMVRSLATGDVEMRDWARRFVKELGIAAALGVTMGLAE
ncbi:MAG: CBS domain-containing protein [Pyrinomonadaceae bacterium]